MSRHELANEQWAIVEPLLPKRKPGLGRPFERRKRTSQAWTANPGERKLCTALEGGMLLRLEG